MPEIWASVSFACPAAYSDHNPCPFAIWGIDIVGKLPLAREGLKYVVGCSRLLYKVHGSKALATITADKIIRFIYHASFCRYEVPAESVSNNGTQFDNVKFMKFCDAHKV